MNKFQRGFSSNKMSRTLFILVAASACVVSSACGRRAGGGNTSEARGIIIVNAPATGEVRRINVGEGVAVNEGAAIIEIAVRNEAQNIPPAQQQIAENPLARAGKNVAASQTEIKAARAEVVRYEVEVQRLAPLVASGQSSQGELDGARAMFDRAEQRLRKAQDAAQSAQAGVVVARQQTQNPVAVTAPSSPTEQIISARATSAGTVSIINVRPGQHVTEGQPLATLRAGQP